MRKIKIVAVGSLSPEFKVLFNQYAKNISHYAQLSIVEIKEFSEEKNIEVKKDKETKLINSHISDDTYVIYASLNGKSLDSVELSNIVNNNTNLTFIIGGSDGVNEDLINCNMKINFSKLTWPHQLFRVMLAEQIYRSFMIINNKKYHK
ncbi:23S rRNA (pseudouridine(1915)-N(3))-methyltransferase RlmH [Mycoplasmopsis caviae]|uniref:Ribosomal RNA large subunit methyltransferase H n=1 Tax=Mycoplasmopsis caviae TaxID=55603 RepID=A0A3P8LAN9_9BACT|nr:23S rRNA (pseudouridine(1915)-N(3))-methyltransferase RlmH [Mycoplasmopsis caviae]UUD35319.1 23S rRNA (pseudouridine(1915)-N(3))-methyltransferase RlmH [Mycoplasmopsis caviae]VDR41901.1 ribosomal RNA large subunit methyltransferase h [Mycoplasmopsis caviae]